jgi:hypothetical protein
MTLSIVVVVSIPDLVSAQVPGGSTPSVSGAVPTNTVYPAITGTARVPNTLTASRGTWGKTPTSFANAWYRCTSSAARATAKPATCTLVAGQTGSTYVLSASDVGKFIVAAVTATNSSGSLTRWSASTAAVIAQYLPPVNTVAPAIRGTKAVGHVLEVSDGTWSNSPTSYSYKWFRCTAATTAANSKPAACTEILGETNAGYMTQSTDARKFIVASVKATNQASSVQKWSASTTSVVDVVSPPANTAPPLVTGTPTNSNTLTASTGTWTNYPPSLTFQWFRCNTRVAAANSLSDACTPIHFMGQSTYVLTNADVGKFIGVAVGAGNLVGYATKWSGTTTTAVAALPVPANATAPAISGTARIPNYLTLSNGSWNWNPTNFSYKWYTCTAAKAAAATLPAGCTQISGATESTYQLMPAQQGRFVLGMVTATNASGSATRYSATTASVAISAFVPFPVVYPTVSGDRTVGEVLSVSPGSWVAYPVATTRYQWYRCDPTYANGYYGPQEPNPYCFEILGATSTTYTQTPDDDGMVVGVAEFQTNSAGSAFVRLSGEPTHPQPTAPRNLVPPTLSGTAVQGTILTALTGTWTGYPTPTISVRWVLCRSSSPVFAHHTLWYGPPENGMRCTTLATGTEYTVQAGDIDRFVFAVVCAQNGLRDPNAPDYLSVCTFARSVGKTVSAASASPRTSPGGIHLALLHVR